MANLIIVFYTDTDMDTKNLIPGDVIIKIRKEGTVINSSNMNNISIVDIKTRELIYANTMCEYCEKFHITENFLKLYLGQHWGKYKKMYWRCGIPISYTSSCLE